MVGHQHVGMQLRLGSLERFAEPVQVGMEVLLRKEARFTIVTTLHDVQRQAVEVDAGAARHGQFIAGENNSTLAPLTRKAINVGRVCKQRTDVCVIHRRHLKSP